MSKKLFKRCISILLGLTLLIIPVTSFAETYTYANIFSGDTPNSLINNTSQPTNLKMLNATGIGGKLASDKCYEFHSIITDPYGQIPVTSASGSDDVVEFSVCVPSDGNGISLNIQIFDGNATTAGDTISLCVDTEGLKYNYTSDKTVIANLQPGTWHNIAFVAPKGSTYSTDSVDKSYEIYVDGVLKNTRNINKATAKGIRSFRYYYGTKGTIDDVCIYLDNLRLSNEEYVPERDMLPTIDYPYSINANNEIKYRPNTTVAQLKADIVKDEFTSIRVYDDDTFKTVLADDAIVSESDVVVAATTNDTNLEKAYSYYAVKDFAYEYENAFTGATPEKLINGGQNLSNIKMTAEGGIAGKSSDDLAYGFYSTTTDKIGLVQPTYAKGVNDIIEFSICIPKGAPGVQLQFQLFKDTESSWENLPINFKDDGIYYAFSDNTKKMHEIEADKWYNICFVAPEGGTNDTKCELYVNGILAEEISWKKSCSGIRYLRIVKNGGSMETPCCYFDNIRISNAKYVPDYDKAPVAVSDIFEINGNVITVPAGTSVNDLITSADVPEGINLRVMNTLATKPIYLTGVDEVFDGNVIVVESKNGTVLNRGYSYYTVKPVEYKADVNVLVNGAAADTYSDGDSIVISVNFSNYVNTPKNVVMYVAQYNDYTLTKLWTDNEEAVLGNTCTLTCDISEMIGRKDSNVKIFIIEEGSLMPYTLPAGLNYTAR